MRNKRNSRRWIGLCVLAAIIVGGVFFPFAGERFDPEVWNSPQAKQRGVRVEMVDDLLARYSLAEKTRAGVVALLGPPEQTAYFGDWDMVYWLGPERGFAAIDSAWLVLRLGLEDRVLEVQVVSD